MLPQEASVGRVHAQATVESRLVGRRSHLAARLVDDQPFRMLFGGELVPLDGGVDRHADVVGMAGGDLLGQQVAGQMRMPALRMRYRVVIHPAMMATCKAGDRVHPCSLQCGGELLRVERFSDAGNLLGGMEIQVDLSEAQLSGGHRSISFLGTQSRTGAPSIPPWRETAKGARRSEESPATGPG